MDRGPESGSIDHEGQESSLLARRSQKGPGIAVVILLVILFDFAMWFIVPDGATYHSDAGTHRREVYLSPLALLLTGLLAGGIFVILSRRGK